MTVSHILEEVRNAGLTLRLTTTGKINARPVDRITPTLREQLKTHRADLAIALSKPLRIKRKATPAATSGDELDRLLHEAAMRCCDHWNDGPEARAQMVAEIRATPKHHRQALLEHFQCWYGKPK
jgi:hypothetical protein